MIPITMIKRGQGGLEHDDMNFAKCINQPSIMEQRTTVINSRSSCYMGMK